MLSFKIYAKYLRHSSPAHLEFVPEKLRSDTYEYLENARQDRELLGPELFLELQRSCFKEIFDHTFLKMKEEHELRQDVAQLMLFLGVEDMFGGRIKDVLHPRILTGVHSLGRYLA